MPATIVLGQYALGSLGYFPVNVAEVISLTESTPVEISTILSENILISDNAVISATLSLPDTIIIQDTDSAAASIKIQDAAAILESPILNINLKETDTIQNIDGLSAGISLILLDTLSTTDSLSTSADVKIADGTLLTDTFSIQSSLSVAESIIITDVATATWTEGIVTIYETFTASDTIAVLAEVGLSDSVSAVDTISQILTALNVTDSLTLTESVLQEAGLSLTDTLTLSDGIAQVYVKTGSTDTVSVQDYLSEIRSKTSVSDIINASENLILNTSLKVGENLYLVDAIVDIVKKIYIRLVFIAEKKYSFTLPNKLYDMIGNQNKKYSIVIEEDNDMFYVGETFKYKVQIKDKVSGILSDPDSVKLTAYLDGVKKIDNQPMLKESTGVYYYEIPFDAPGNWVIKITATAGTIVQIEKDSIYVRE